MFKRTCLFGAAAVLSLIVFAPAEPSARAASPITAVSSDNANVLTGGIGEKERAQLLEVAPQYELVASFARRSDGAMLSQVDVTLSGKTLRESIELTTNGPLLLASLPTGHYVLTARLPGWEERTREIDVEGGHHERMFITFVPKSEP